MKSIVRMLIAMSVALMASPAFSDNLQMPERHLDQADWYHARPHLQIINIDPVVSDLRRAQEHTVYNINIAPPPQSVVHQVNIIGAPSEGSAPSILNAAPPGFTSNISARTGPLTALPPGQKMGSLPPLGSLIKQSTLKTHAIPLTATKPPAQLKAPTQTSRYAPEAFSGSTNLSVTTMAKGTLLK